MANMERRLGKELQSEDVENLLEKSDLEDYLLFEQDLDDPPFMGSLENIPSSSSDNDNESEDEQGDEWLPDPERFSIFKTLVKAAADGRHRGCSRPHLAMQHVADRNRRAHLPGSRCGVQVQPNWCFKASRYKARRADERRGSQRCAAPGGRTVIDDDPQRAPTKNLSSLSHAPFVLLCARMNYCTY
ncbi:unnamed protein product, partial [Brenthis ino]